MDTRKKVVKIVKTFVFHRFTSYSYSVNYSRASLQWLHLSSSKLGDDISDKGATRLTLKFHFNQDFN